MEDLVNAKNAALSIVFSRWGELPAKVLSDNYNVPYIIRPSLPLSADDISDLADSINVKLNLDDGLVQSFLESEKIYEKNLLTRVRDVIIENELSTETIIVGDEELAIRLGLYLKNTIGAEIAGIIITDAIAKDSDHETDNKEILAGISDSVHYTSDQKEIDDIIRASQANIILGSSLERGIAEKLDLVLVETSYPVYDSLTINKSLSGTRGQFSFIENYVTEINLHNKIRRQKLYSFVRGEKNIEEWRDVSQRKSYTRIHSSARDINLKEYAASRVF